MIMPSPEPNKEMEDLLRAYANRRREQGRQELPGELRAAARTKLQDEVRRVFGDARPAAGRAPVWRWLASQWPRLALGGGLAALLILVVFRHDLPVATQKSATLSAASEKSASINQFRNNGQQFVQVNNASTLQSGVPARTTVLANFQMERHGRNVLVYDADGSVYRGTVLESAEAEKDRSKFQNDLVGTASPVGGAIDAVANYSFKVSGMNTDLKQNVVFTGNVFETPRPLMPAGRARSGGGGAGTEVVAGSREGGFGGQGQMAKSGVFQGSPTSNPVQAAVFQNQVPQFLRITGKVQVEGGGEFEIEALPPGR
jgi:hypothetical protein